MNTLFLSSTRIIVQSPDSPLALSLYLSGMLMLMAMALLLLVRVILISIPLCERSFHKSVHKSFNMSDSEARRRRR